MDKNIEENKKECCLSDNSSEKECCCHGKENHGHKGECQCHDNKNHDHKEDCCCQSKGETEIECHSQDKEEDRSCCGIGEQKHQEVGCCCCGEGEKKGGLKGEIIKLAISLVFLVLGFFNWHHIGFAPFYYVNPAWVAVIICGLPIFITAVKTLAKKKVKVPVLISTAMLACIALEILGFFVDISAGSHSHSYVFAAGEVAWLMTLGQMIESFTVKKTRSGIEALLNLIPKEANVKTESGFEKREISQIKVGDVVLVKAGEMIAVDGNVLLGDTSVNQSSVTGESLPVDKGVGDFVYGGTFNVSGSIEVEVTKPVKEMTVAKMAELVEEASGTKAPIAMVADKWASVIVPSAIILAIVVGLVSAFAFHLSWSDALVRGVTILVVFCPCSLALATPTALSAGLGYGAKHGILIKSGTALETLAGTTVIAFDKTGTLTKGEVVLKEVCTDMDERTLLEYVSAVEQYSDHPLAKAVINYIDFTPKAIAQTNTIGGVGIGGKVDDVEVEILGISRYHEDLGEYTQKVAEAKNSGATVTVVLLDKKLKGILVFSDTIKETATEAVSSIKEMGIKTLMLTGDNTQSGEKIASICGVDEVKAELLPKDKLDVITECKKNGERVCMVGDGINDAPSLAGADCGIAMDVLNSDITVEAADMAILDGDMKKVVSAIKLSKRVLSTVKVNIAIAMCVNLIAVVLSLLGILSPATGALVHNLNSILVVLNSALLLKRNK